MEECFTFQWGRGCFSDGAASVLREGGAPHGGDINFDGGGGFRKK